MSTPHNAYVQYNGKRFCSVCGDPAPCPGFLGIAEVDRAQAAARLTHVPSDRVDAVAEALYRRAINSGTWEGAPESLKRIYRKSAVEVLSAADEADTRVDLEAPETLQKVVTAIREHDHAAWLRGYDNTAEERATEILEALK